MSTHATQENARGERLVDAVELAQWLSVDRGWVYEHASELGALRLGSGPRARLRFDLGEVRRRLSVCRDGMGSFVPVSASEGASRSRRPRSLGTNVELLPVKGVS